MLSASSKPIVGHTVAQLALFASVSAIALAETSVTGQAATTYKWLTVANSSTLIPGGAGDKFSSFNQPSINDNCAVVFRARGKGPSTPVSGIFYDLPCTTGIPVRKKLLRGSVVPQPNNLNSTFNEFPAFPRIAVSSDFIATRGQSKPVWSYMLPDGTETRVGTSGVYAGYLTDPMITGASQLGAVPGFSHFDVPGFDGVKFDQFPGSPSPFYGKFIAFKGNFTETLPVTLASNGDAEPVTISRTGVYYRNVFDGGKRAVRRIADTTMNIPGTSTKFGSTAPPSASGDRVVFLGVDNEDKPTKGGIYTSIIPPDGQLGSLARIGGPVHGVPGATFTFLGEGLSLNAGHVAFWGAWGPESRVVRLHCPVDGNQALIDECKKQCPDVDEVGNYCERDVPVNQGIFYRRPSGATALIARAGDARAYHDFLFWVFSGRPPGVGPDDAEEPEPPRWRSSAFAAVTPNSYNGSVVFKAAKASGESGLYIKPRLGVPVEPLALVGSNAKAIDTMAPTGSVVTAVGVERDGFRTCHLAINASFLNTTTSESWAGIYVERNACPPAP